MLVEKQRGALRIVALDRAAARSNLRSGMTLAEARTWLPALRAGEGNMQADRGFRLALANACERFTPLVALRGDDGLVLDITGCAHLFGGERELGGEARRLLTRMGASTRAAIAGTPDAAWAFARFTQDGAAAADEEALARTLPVTALEADTGTTIALSRAGLRTIGDLAERPAALLVARFGEEITRRLDRLLGREDIRISPLRAPADIMAEKHFPEPVSVLESLLGVLERLARDVAAHLERRGEGGRIFEAEFFRSDGIVRRIGVETGRGTRDPRVLMRLLRLRIEALADPLDPGFGFDAIRLGVFRCENLPARQRVLDPGARKREGEGEGEEESLSELAGRLVARFGRENVLGFVMNDTHDPVRAGGTAPCLSVPAPAVPPAPEPGHPPARPLTLFPHPQPIEVIAEVPDGPPHRFRWRRVPHEVTRAEGPERIAPEWWRLGDMVSATRDYYRIEDAAGHRFWIFREGLYDTDGAAPRWFVHGLFS